MAEFDYSLEKRILISFITNDEFCKEILPITQKEFFTNEYAQTIVRWVAKYFDTYGTAPHNEMEDIYLQNKDSISDGAANIIVTILEHLDTVDTSAFDTRHSIDMARDFFQERLLVLTANTALHELEQGHLEDAMNQLKSYKGIETTDGGVDNTYTNKTLQSAIIEKLWYPEESKDIALRVQGAFGDFLGNMEYGWLMAFLAPMKRGKTTLLTEMAIESVMQRKNTLFVSLEMPDKDMALKGALALTGLRPTKSNKMIFPVFDCLRNQNGSCIKPQRIQGNRAITEVLTPALLKMHHGHTPCTKCRGTMDFQPSVWYVEEDNIVTPSKFTSIMRAFSPMMGRYMRTRSYPPRSVSINSIIAHMDVLAKTQRFDTQVLIIDYADLMLAVKKHIETRHALDEVWTALKALANKRGILVITASQTNRGGMLLEELTSDTIAEDIRKVAIVDGLFGLNQTPAEKQKGIMRIGSLEQRHDAQFTQCYLLQDFYRSQFCMDSEIGAFFSSQKTETNNRYKK